MTAIPTGRPEALRVAAAGWRDMGTQLDSIVGHLDRQVRDARESHWSGPAADAFGEQWTQIKRSVDEAQPVFELAATELDSAADRMETGHGEPGGAHSAPPAADHTQYAMQIGYAASALSQMGPMLATTFGKRGKGGKGRSGVPMGTPSGWKPTAEGAHLPSGAIDATAQPPTPKPAKPKPDATNFGAFG